MKKSKGQNIDPQLLNQSSQPSITVSIISKLSKRTIRKSFSLTSINLLKMRSRKTLKKQMLLIIFRLLDQAILSKTLKCIIATTIMLRRRKRRKEVKPLYLRTRLFYKKKVTE